MKFDRTSSRRLIARSLVGIAVLAGAHGGMRAQGRSSVSFSVCSGVPAGSPCFVQRNGEGDVVSLNVSATSTSGAPSLSYKVTAVDNATGRGGSGLNGLPAGLIWGSASGVLSFAGSLTASAPGADDGSVGLYTVTVIATDSSLMKNSNTATLVFTWDVSRWSQGDVFVGIGTPETFNGNPNTSPIYSVYDKNGVWKQSVAIQDIPPHSELRSISPITGTTTLDGFTGNCGVNHATGEVFAPNLDTYYPGVNVIKRQPPYSHDPRVDPSARLSTYRSAGPLGHFPVDAVPESVVFDNFTQNFYVGHSGGFFLDDTITTADSQGRPTVGVVYLVFTNGSGDPILASNGNLLWSASFNDPAFASYASNWVIPVTSTMGVGANGPVPMFFQGAPGKADGYFDDSQVWVSPDGYYLSGDGVKYLWGATSPQVLSGQAQAGTLMPVHEQWGRDLHRYMYDATKTPHWAASPGRVNYFNTRYGWTGTDQLDVSRTGKVFYTSETNYVYMYDPNVPGNNPANTDPLGSGPAATQPTFAGPLLGIGNLLGIRLLPPGNGIDGGMVVVNYPNEILRLDNTGQIVQHYSVPGGVNGWYAVDVDPDGRTMWATTGAEIYHFDIATTNLIPIGCSGMAALRKGLCQGMPLKIVIYNDPGPTASHEIPASVSGVCVLNEYTTTSVRCAVDANGQTTGLDTTDKINPYCSAAPICSPDDRPGDANNNHVWDVNDPVCGAPLGVCPAGATSDPNIGGFCNRINNEGDVITVHLSPMADCSSGTSYAATGLPAGLVLDPCTGIISGAVSYDDVVPDPTSPKVHNVTVTISWSAGQTWPAGEIAIPFDWTVNNKNRPPSAGADSFPAFPAVFVPGTPAVTLDVLANDSDPDGDPLHPNPNGDTIKITSVTQPLGGNGTVAIVTGGLFVQYTPPATSVAASTTFTYTITDLSGATSTATVTIHLAVIAVTPAVTAPDKAYDGTATATTACTLNVTDPTVACVAATSTFVDRNVGTGNIVTATGITLTGTGASRYALSTTIATTTANIKPVLLVITAKSGTKTYGTVFTVTPSFAGFVNNETNAVLTTQPACTSLGSPATAPVSGSPYATACASAVAANYTISYVPGTVTVTPAALTITASSGTMVYGGTVPTITASYAGFINGDTAASLTTAPTCTTTATSASPAGTYPTSCTGAVDANYAISYVTGAVTVLPVVPPSCSVGYPFASSEPRTNIAFNENEVLRAFAQAGTGADQTIRVWYSDEHALALGVRQVTVKTASGTTTTNYVVTPLASNPGSAFNPAVGSTVLTGDQAGTDLSGRPMYPALFITDITANAASRAGDWQYGGRPIAPHAVFGTWKGAVRTVTSSGTTVMVDADPTKNNWALGAGSDAPPTGTFNQGYGTEVRWNVNDLRISGQPLQAGHVYRVQFMVHDGDQNKVGGDAGEACLNITPTPAGAAPALTLTKSVDKATAAPADLLTYTLTYGNAGSVSATGVTLSDVLPAHTTFVSASNGGTNTSGTVTWAVGAVAPGAGGTVTVTVRLDATWPTGTTTVTNSASVTSTETPRPIVSAPVVTTVTAAAQCVTISAGNNAYHTDRGVTFSIGAPGVLDNDVDQAHRTLTVGQVNGSASNVGRPAPTAHGTVKLNADGSFTYDPAGNYTGTDTFTYRAKASDGTLSSMATVTVTILASHCQADDQYKNDDDRRHFGDGSDDQDGRDRHGRDGDGYDRDGYDRLGLDAHGHDKAGNDRQHHYGRDGRDAGGYDNDGFDRDGRDRDGCDKYGIDRDGHSRYDRDDSDKDDHDDLGEVCNAEPVAANDTYSTPKNTTLTIGAPGVLNNDADPDGNSVTAVLVTGVSQGTLTLNAAGSFIYKPATGFTGTDSFKYQAKDPSGAVSNVATVTITVADRAPTADNESYAADQNTVLSVSSSNGVLTGDADSDGDALTAQLVAGPSNGTLVLNSNGSFTYKPATGFTGTDSFTYGASDGTLTSNVATVTITVSKCPTAHDHSYSGSKGKNVSGNVLDNCDHDSSRTVSAQQDSNCAHGTITWSRDGTFTYTPSSNYTGTDSFTFHATDSAGKCSKTQTVTIKVG